MQKDSLNILVVEDDQNLAKALSAAIERGGYRAHVAHNPDEALNICKFQSIHLAVIDCMLPKMGGRELVGKLKAESSSSLPVVMMSGIYKDRAFIRETVQATGALAFLSKPFDLSDFMSKLDEQLSAMVDVPVERLQQFLATQTLSPKERISAVDEASVVHGFDLPWIYSLLMHPKVSGHLNIIDADGEVSSVAFANGTIAQVFQEDARSYFGALLVEHGFVNQQDLDSAIKGALKGKRLGEKLIDANLLSPHAIDVVMREQQGIRLARTVTDTSVKINFVETEDMAINTMIDRSTFSTLLNDWLGSKLTTSWLKSYYLPWMNLSIKKGPEWSPNHSIMAQSVIKRIPNFAATILSAASLEEASAQLKCSEDHFFRAVHAMTVSRVLIFGESSQSEDFDSLRARITKICQTLKEQNYFERLGVSRKAKDTEIKRNYHELAKALHPDKLAADVPKDIRALSEKTFEMIGTAYATLADASKRSQYITVLDQGSTELSLKAEQLADQARPLLNKGDVAHAKKLLEQSVALIPPRPTTKLMYVWAKLKTSDRPRNQLELTAISEELSSIPAEDRHTSLYLFVKALYLRSSGDISGAKRILEHVLNQDSEFFAARRELNVLIAQQNNSSGKSINELLKGDLKDVVGMLFRKKK